MFQDFRDFIAKGNVMDMAVGIIIGAAFTSIVKSLVSDVINPVISIFTGGIDFSNLYINLSGGEYETLSAAQNAGALTLNYGLFANAVLNFLIVAFVVFIMVRYVNKLKNLAIDPHAAEKTATPPPPPADIQLLTEIRDLLKEKK